MYVPVRILGLSALRFIKMMCDGSIYQMDPNSHWHWRYLADHAHTYFSGFFADVVEDQLIHLDRRLSRFGIQIRVPSDIRFNESSYALLNSESYPSFPQTTHIRITSPYFREFHIELLSPGEEIFERPRDMLDFINHVSLYILDHISSLITHEQIDNNIQQIRFSRDEFRSEYSNWQQRDYFYTDVVRNKRAEELLLSQCTTEQQRQWENHNYIIVIGNSGTRYKLKPLAQINVDVVDQDGRKLYRLCTIADSDSKDIPIEDQILAQKTMIELREQEFLNIAIRH